MLPIETTLWLQLEVSEDHVPEAITLLRRHLEVCTYITPSYAKPGEMCPLGAPMFATHHSCMYE